MCDKNNGTPCNCGGGCTCQKKDKVIVDCDGVGCSDCKDGEITMDYYCIAAHKQLDICKHCGTMHDIRTACPSV